MQTYLLAKMKDKIIFALVLIFAALPMATGAASFSVNSFSCTPSEAVLNDAFSCTAQIINSGDASGTVSTVILYPDSNDWLEDSNYPQASGTSVDPGQTTEVTFSGLRTVKTGSNGFSKIMLDDVADTYVDDNNIEVNVIDVVVAVSESDSTVAMGASFDSTAEVTAGGNIDVSLTFSVSSGGCSIGNQDSTKTLSDMQDGNKQSRTWAVTQGTSGDCRYTISASATGEGGVVTTSDSTSRTVICTDCPTGGGSSSSSGGGGGGGGGATTTTVTYPLGEISSSTAVDLGVNEKATFSVDDLEHELILKELLETQVKIEINSETQTFTLFVEDEKLIDLSEDNFADVSVKLKSINILTNKARFILSPVREGIPADVGEEVGLSPEEESAGKSGEDIFGGGNNFVWIIVFLGIILIVIGVVYFYKKNRRPTYEPIRKRNALHISIFIIAILIAGFFIYNYNSQKVITGRVVDKIDDAENNLGVGESKSCSDSDGKNYLVRGKISYCEDGECASDEDFCSGRVLNEFYCEGSNKNFVEYVCENECDEGTCANLITDYNISSRRSGGGGGGGGSSSGGSSEIITTSITTHDLGELDSEETIDISEGNRISFAVNGNIYTATLDDNSETVATLIFSSGRMLTLDVGEEEAVDLNSDSANDIYIRLRSVNIFNSKVKLTLRVFS